MTTTLGILIAGGRSERFGWSPWGRRVHPVHAVVTALVRALGARASLPRHRS